MKPDNSFSRLKRNLVNKFTRTNDNTDDDVTECTEDELAYNLMETPIQPQQAKADKLQPEGRPIVNPLPYWAFSQ